MNEPITIERKAEIGVRCDAARRALSIRILKPEEQRLARLLTVALADIHTLLFEVERLAAARGNLVKTLKRICQCWNDGELGYEAVEHAICLADGLLAVELELAAEKVDTGRAIS